MAVVMLPVVIFICMYVLLNPRDYSGVVLSIISGTLVADLIGIMGAVYRMILNSGGSHDLAPLTTSATKKSKDESPKRATGR
jgi:hypothetical protein